MADASKKLDQGLIDRLKAAPPGTEIDGYSIGDGNAIYDPTQSAENQTPKYEQVIYGNQGGGGWDDNTWETWEMSGDYRGTGSGMSTAKGLVTFVLLAAASYYGATAINGAGAPATTAATSSTVAPVAEAGAIDLVGGAGLGGTEATLTGGSSILTGGGVPTISQSAASAWGVGGLEGAMTAGGSALNTFGDAAGKSIIDGAKDLAIDQGKKTLVQEGGKSMWDQLDNSKLVNTGLNIAGGAISSYAQQKAAQEADEAKSKKILDGARSGLGLTLWGNTRKGK